MEILIQRRSIYLAPPTERDLAWVWAQFEDREVWQMFGGTGPGAEPFRQIHDQGHAAILIIRRVAGRAAIGFVIIFGPLGDPPEWELALAIPDPAERNAFSAMNAGDAAVHFAFDHLGVETLQWRIRSDNSASLALIRRMGYRPTHGRVTGGHYTIFWQIDRAAWNQRRERLRRGDADPFVILSGPPFEPESG